MARRTVLTDGAEHRPHGVADRVVAGIPRMLAMAGFHDRTAMSSPTVKMPSDDDSSTSLSVRRSDCTSVKSDRRWSVDDTRWARASSIDSCCAV